MRFGFLILCILLPLSACADSALAGDWNTTNGAYFTIPKGDAGRFQLTLTDSKGEKIFFPATWVKPGEEFHWTDKQGAAHVAERDARHRPERIKDVGANAPGSPAYWYRKAP